MARTQKMMIEVCRMRQGRGGEFKIEGFERYRCGSLEINRDSIHLYYPIEGYDLTNEKEIECEEHVHILKLRKWDSAKPYRLDELGGVIW